MSLSCFFFSAAQGQDIPDLIQFGHDLLRQLGGPQRAAAAEHQVQGFQDATWAKVAGQNCHIHRVLESEKKNKMKPTNPNADTYVDKQRQYLFVTLPANSLVRHPEFTHWGDTLVGRPCLTLLRKSPVRHSCLTLFLDTLIWHSCKTLLLDTLVGHFLLDTLVRHSYLTLLTWHFCKTLLLDTLVRHSYLTLL